jgi:alpha-2-macroglobulin
MPLVFEGLGIALVKTLGKIVSAQETAAFGCLFFWILFFGQAKKSIAVVGPRTDST